MEPPAAGLRSPLGSTRSCRRDTRAQTWVLQRFGFTWSSAHATPLAIGHSLSALPSDESVEPSGSYPELVGCLITSGMGLVLGGRRSVFLTGHSDASWVDDQATQRSSHGYTFSLGSGSVSWRSTCSSSVLSSSCEAEIYATAMAAQELRWLTYLLTDLGERPSSPPVLYVDNKAAIALCQEHSLEHRTKHIALRYFLARELLQRGQLRLRYVATRANTADIFTKALQPCDHQRFCTIPGLLALPFLTGLVTRRSHVSVGWYVTVWSKVSKSHLPRFLARLRHRALLASRVDSALTLTPCSSPPVPFQTLHLDVWASSLFLGPRQERCFLIVVDDYYRYTTVFPLRWKADVPTVLEP
ncbi:unnamed protein product [Closterium sp. NIES-53]